MTKTIFASMRSIEKCHWMDLVNEKERSWCCEVTTWRQLQMSINARMQSGRFNTESAETLKRGEHTHKMIQVKHRIVCCFHNNNFIPNQNAHLDNLNWILKDRNVGQKQYFRWFATQTDITNWTMCGIIQKRLRHLSLAI